MTGHKRHSMKEIHMRHLASAGRWTGRLTALALLAGAALGVGETAVAGAHASAAPATAQMPEPGSAPVIATFRGSDDGRTLGGQAVGPVALRAGLVVLHARHGGTGGFSVSLATVPAGGSPQTDYDFSRLVINSDGRYDGAVATLLPKDGDYYLMVSTGGVFDLRVEQPLPENLTPVDAREFAGERQQVTPVLALPAGTYTIHVTSAATARLFAWLYRVDDLGGSMVFDSSDGRFLQQSGGPFDESVTLTLRQGGLFLFHIDANSYDNAADPPGWTVQIQEG
jgi:hypothetical protein